MTAKKAPLIHLTLLATLLLSLPHAHAAPSKKDAPKVPTSNAKAARQWLKKIGMNNEPGVHERRHKSVLSVFRSVVAPAAKSVVAIYGDQKQCALGTVVDGEGFVLTKASELLGKLECLTADGRKLPAKIVGVHPQHDLAMLKIEADKLAPIQWNASKNIPVGSWLATPGLGEDPFLVGVVSAAPRKIASPRGVLGVLLEEDQRGARVNQVLADSGAEKAGLLVNDVITGLNGKKIDSRTALIQSIRKMQPGDKVKLTVVRGEEKLNLTAELGTLQMGGDQKRREFQNRLGATLSKRRTGFPSVLQHDSALHPVICGGPIVDLHGKAVGINIARAGRVASYAIPASVVQGLLADLKSGKLAPPAKKKEKKMAAAQ